MPDEARYTICHHTKSDGIRCGSPALRGRRFCYYHYNRTRVTIRKEVPALDNAQALQSEVAAVVDGLRTGALDSKRGHLLLFGLQLAIQNLRNCQEKGAEANTRSFDSGAQAGRALAQDDRLR